MIDWLSFKQASNHGEDIVFDTTNRLRNLLGNYRFVSYQMRLWALRGKLGIFASSIENQLLAAGRKHYGNAHPWTTLDLGCGNYPQNPFNAEHVAGCDIREDLEANVRRCNLALEPIPFASESIDFVTAYQFIEHIPRLLAHGTSTRFPFIELMSEVHRVLKPGGLFYAKTPSFPSGEAFQDPTHVNFINHNTFPYYFCWHPYGGPWGRIYGFQGKFELLKQRRQGPDLLTLLKKLP